MSGCVHIYCGDGKGKTSAAIGLAVRAVGRGKNVLIARFLKSDDSGEVSVLQGITGITLLPCWRIFGFVFRMSTEEKEAAAVYFKQRFQEVKVLAVSGEYDVVILDEIIASCNYGMVEEGAVCEFLQERPKALEVVLTGRNPSEALLELADYVSEIKMVKHPYEKGISAREGIEY